MAIAINIIQYNTINGYFCIPSREKVSTYQFKVQCIAWNSTSITYLQHQDHLNNAPGRKVLLVHSGSQEKAQIQVHGKISSESHTGQIVQYICGLKMVEVVLN